MLRLCTVGVVFGCALLGAARGRAAGPPTRTVVTIQFGPAAFPSNPVLDAGIRSVLLAPDAPPVDYFTEYLESEHLGTERAANALAEYVRVKYRGRRLDLVVAMGTPSLAFALAHRRDLFQDAPMIFAGLEAPDDATRTSGAGIASLVVSNAYAETLDAALRLHPDTQRVFVVATSPTSESVASVREHLRPFSSRVTLSYLDPRSVEDLLNAVRRTPARSVILYIWYSRDQPGNVITPAKIAGLVAAASPVPVYATSDLSIGTGVVGGVVRRTDETGVRVGQIALDVLGGRRTQDIPIETARLVPLFDGRQLAHWGIDERNLPAGAVVISRPPSLWVDYRKTVIVVLGVGLLQFGLIGGLLYQRRARRRAELRTREHLTITAHMGRQLAMGELAASMAHELSQPLGAIQLNAQAANRLLRANPAPADELREILDDIVRDDARASQIIQRQRAMLQKRELDQGRIDLNEVVHESLAIVQHDADVRQVRLQTELCSELPVVVGDRILLQQVLVNLVINAMDAMASTPTSSRQIIVRTQTTLRAVDVSVEDRGSGVATEMAAHLFDPFVTTKPKGMGVGLTIVRGIIEAHHGTIHAINNPEGGATFRFCLPIHGAQTPGISADLQASA